MHVAMPSSKVEADTISCNALTKVEANTISHSAGQHHSTVKTNTNSYNAAISACEKGWRQMEVNTISYSAGKVATMTANTNSYNAAISACEKGQSLWRRTPTVTMR